MSMLNELLSLENSVFNTLIEGVKSIKTYENQNRMYQLLIDKYPDSVDTVSGCRSKIAVNIAKIDELKVSLAMFN